MNFLLRQSQAAAAVSSPSSSSSSNQIPKPTSFVKQPSKGVTTLEGLIAGEKSKSPDSYRSSGATSFSSGNNSNSNGNNQGEIVDYNNGNLINSSNFDMNFVSNVDKFVDVSDDQGWITIPFKKLPDDWDNASDMQGFQSLDRSFVFPGEQVHILACLSASKQDPESMTSLKIAGAIVENDVEKGVKDQNKNISDQESSSSPQKLDSDDLDTKSVNTPSSEASVNDKSSQIDDQRTLTQTLLQRFQDSHFFVRISDSGEQLWAKKGPKETSEIDDVENDKVSVGSEASVSALIDDNSFDSQASGGVARNSVKCCSLSNGDIVVLLQVNVGVDFLKNPVLEILQFEKHHDGFTGLNTDILIKEEFSPSWELLKWLLPLENNPYLPVNRSSSSTPSSPSPLLNPSYKSSFSASSGSPLFSLNNFRTYSLTSGSTASPTPVSAGTSKPNFDLEDWDSFMSQNSVKTPKRGSEDLLSFRGVPLESERFSVCCGLQGLYVPGRRWRKELEIVQPVDIRTSASNCNTDDLLCVQIKNISPAHIPDIIVYIDAITIILEEASKGGHPVSVPVACIEAGTDHGLPNLALRRGEDHSFIMKPSATMLNRSNAHHGDKISQFRSKAGSKAASMRRHPTPATTVEATRNGSASDKYAVLVSCRSNYSESRLFFKKSIDWRPRMSRDFMISVAAETSIQTPELSRKVSQLPVQVLTLQASNLTSEDLNLTILAPPSFAPPPSVHSLNSVPSSPASSYAFVTAQRSSSAPRVQLAENEKRSDNQSLSFEEQAVPVADAIPTTALSCTHLWLHSRVPLGCVPSQSTSTIKLELLPLTDGVITLDTLQIFVKEKGVTYVPEQALKFNTTSSIATGIV